MHITGSVNGSFHIFIKGTDLDITGKKSLEWEISNKDTMVSMTIPDAAAAEFSRSTIGASDVNITINKSAIELIKLPGIKKPFQLSAITHFLVEMDTVQAADKAHGSHRSKKSSKVVNNSSDDDEVVVLTVPSEDTEMADAQKGLNASMHALKPATTEAVKSLHFTKEKKMPKEKKDHLTTSSSIHAELSKSSKCPCLEHPIADLHEESPEESNLQVTGADSIIKHTALSPTSFIMRCLPSNTIFNFSPPSMSSLLELADKPMANAEVIPNPQETLARPSNTASQVAE
uniref:Uncharacterized protein n=1 Tax=Moniliophthora roreri TaxID=221103 RepID=A0A0W0FKI8_MONRR